MAREDKNKPDAEEAPKRVAIEQDPDRPVFQKIKGVWHCYVTSEESAVGAVEGKKYSGLKVHGKKSGHWQPIVGMIDGLTRYPLWDGTLNELPSGNFLPRIFQVTTSPNANGGKSVAMAKAKGYREISDIPDEFAYIKKPYMEALAAWQKDERDAATERERLAKLGVRIPGHRATTLKTVTTAS